MPQAATKRVMTSDESARQSLEAEFLGELKQIRQLLQGMSKNLAEIKSKMYWGGVPSD
jgi:hypothetical protein